MAKSRKQQAAEKIDNLIEAEYYKQASGVQVSVMDIGKIFAECRADLLAGKTMENAVKSAIAKYRKN